MSEKINFERYFLENWPITEEQTDVEDIGSQSYTKLFPFAKLSRTDLDANGNLS